MDLKKCGFSKKACPATEVSSETSNGVTVASESAVEVTSTAKVWIDAGSRYDSYRNDIGSSKVLEHLAFKNAKSQTEITNPSNNATQESDLLSSMEDVQLVDPIEGGVEGDSHPEMNVFSKIGAASDVDLPTEGESGVQSAAAAQSSEVLHRPARVVTARAVIDQQAAILASHYLLARTHKNGKDRTGYRCCGAEIVLRATGVEICPQTASNRFKPAETLLKQEAVSIFQRVAPLLPSHHPLPRYLNGMHVGFDQGFIPCTDLCLICGGKDEPSSVNDQLTRSRAYLKAHEEDATPEQIDTTVESLTGEAKKHAVNGPSQKSQQPQFGKKERNSTVLNKRKAIVAEDLNREDNSSDDDDLMSSHVHSKAMGKGKVISKKTNKESGALPQGRFGSSRTTRRDTSPSEEVEEEVVQVSKVVRRRGAKKRVISSSGDESTSVVVASTPLVLKEVEVGGGCSQNDEQDFEANQSSDGGGDGNEATYRVESSNKAVKQGGVTGNESRDEMMTSVEGTQEQVKPSSAMEQFPSGMVAASNVTVGNTLAGSISKFPISAVPSNAISALLGCGSDKEKVEEEEENEVNTSSVVVDRDEEVERGSGGDKYSCSSFEPTNRNDDEKKEEDFNGDSDKTQSLLQIADVSVVIESEGGAPIESQSDGAARLGSESIDNAQTVLESSPSADCEEEEEENSACGSTSEGSEEEEEVDFTDIVNLEMLSLTTPLKGVLKPRSARYLSPPPPPRMSTPQSGDSVHSFISPLKEDATVDDREVYQNLQSAQKQKKYLNETANQDGFYGKIDMFKKLPSTPIRAKKNMFSSQDPARRTHVNPNQRMIVYTVPFDYTYARREIFNKLSEALHKESEELFLHTLDRYGCNLEDDEEEQRGVHELHQCEVPRGTTAEQAQQQAFLMLSHLQQLVRAGLPTNCDEHKLSYCRQRLGFVIVFEKAVHFLALSLVVACDPFWPTVQGVPRPEPLDVAVDQLLPDLTKVVKASKLAGVKDALDALRSDHVNELVSHVKNNGFFDLFEAAPSSPVSASGPNCLLAATIADKTLHAICLSPSGAESELDANQNGPQSAVERSVRVECTKFAEALKTALDARLVAQSKVDTCTPLEQAAAVEDFQGCDARCVRLIEATFAQIERLVDRELGPEGQLQVVELAYELRCLAVAVGRTHVDVFEKGLTHLLGVDPAHTLEAYNHRNDPDHTVPSVKESCGLVVRTLVEMTRRVYSNPDIAPTEEQLSELAQASQEAQKTVQEAHKEQLSIGEKGDLSGLSKLLLTVLLEGVCTPEDEEAWDSVFCTLLVTGFSKLPEYMFDEQDFEQDFDEEEEEVESGSHVDEEAEKEVEVDSEFQSEQEVDVETDAGSDLESSVLTASQCGEEEADDDEEVEVELELEEVSSVASDDGASERDLIASLDLAASVGVGTVQEECAELNEAFKTVLRDRQAEHYRSITGSDSERSAALSAVQLLDERCVKLVEKFFDRFAQLIDRELGPDGEGQTGAVAREIRHIATAVVRICPVVFITGLAHLLGRHAARHAIFLDAVRDSPTLTLCSVRHICELAMHNVVETARLIYSDPDITPTEEQLSELAQANQAARKVIQEAYLDQLSLGDKGGFSSISIQLLMFLSEGVRSVDEEEKCDAWLGQLLEMGFVSVEQDEEEAEEVEAGDSSDLDVSVSQSGEEEAKQDEEEQEEEDEEEFEGLQELSALISDDDASERDLLASQLATSLCGDADERSVLGLRLLFSKLLRPRLVSGFLDEKGARRLGEVCRAMIA